LQKQSKNFSESTSQLPNNDDESLLVGCRKKENVEKFFHRSAGILCAVRPCGTIIWWTELYTMESCSQIFTFLLKMIEDNCKVKCVCYDRACEYVPFLRNLAKKKNVGAQNMLNNTLFMVDNFHVRKHKQIACMPPPAVNPNNLYHPECTQFKEFSDVNTSIAESVFAWIKSLRRVVRLMTEEKFVFFVNTVIAKHNEYRNRP